MLPFAAFPVGWVEVQRAEAEVLRAEAASKAALTAQTKEAMLQAFAESSVFSAEDKASAIAEWNKQVFGM